VYWALPLAIVYLVKNRDWRSPGLEVRRAKAGVYLRDASIGLALPVWITGWDDRLAAEFAEQFACMAVAEEFFFRGYFMRRQCDWLGDSKGLWLSALLFGLAHAVSRISQHGLMYPVRLVEVFAETFAGGLLPGAVFLRAKNIVPGTIIHTAGNVYISRLLELWVS
jgi:membrane protease YdiL (CAAX protease family)